MKKKLTFLLTTLVLALALCATAAAAESVQVSGLTQGQTGYLAGYNDSGRMVGVRVLTADGPAAAIPNATSYKLLRLDGDLTPQAPASAFTPVQSKGVVRKVDGQVCICYDGPEGLMMTQPVTTKITGKVYSIDTRGLLTINGKKYPPTDLTVEGCAYDISTEGFQCWFFTNSPLVATCDFYLDANGAICWIDQVSDSDHQICVPLAARLEGDELLVEVRLYKTTDILTITRLDGQAIGDSPDCISPADALAQLQADCEGAFYTYSLQAGDGCYHLVRAGKDSPVDTGYAWGERYVIPQGSATQPAADFSFGAVSCLADERTIFYLAAGEPGSQIFFVYRGFQHLPFAQAKGCALTRPDGVADLVYLDFTHFAVEPPQGYIMVVNRNWDNAPNLEKVYQMNIADADGERTTLRVPEGLRNAILEDSMELDRFADNTYVGKPCRITVLDHDQVALGLEPVETYEVRALGGGSLITDAGSWTYDDQTHFVFAELSIVPIDPLPDEVQCMEYSGSGTFNPDHFRPDEIGPDQMYASVRAAVIPNANDDTLADYVYIVFTAN